MGPQLIALFRKHRKYEEKGAPDTNEGDGIEKNRPTSQRELSYGTIVTRAKVEMIHPTNNN